MSHARKHIDEEFASFPVPEEDQVIARVTDVRGGNIVEVEFADGARTLCMIPTKYRKKVWIRNGKRNNIIFIFDCTCNEAYSHELLN